MHVSVASAAALHGIVTTTTIRKLADLTRSRILLLSIIYRSAELQLLAVPLAHFGPNTPWHPALKRLFSSTIHRYSAPRPNRRVLTFGLRPNRPGCGKLAQKATSNEGFKQASIERSVSTSGDTEAGDGRLRISLRFMRAQRADNPLPTRYILCSASARRVQARPRKGAGSS
jgi:hypothetical protein